MTHHVHLWVRPAEVGGVSRRMQTIGRRYVAFLNARYRRTGILWEGRFKSALADSDRYLRTCYRCIELNPVRAGRVPGPREHPGSATPAMPTAATTRASPRTRPSCDSAAPTTNADAPTSYSSEKPSTPRKPPTCAPTPNSNASGAATACAPRSKLLLSVPPPSVRAAVQDHPKNDPDHFVTEVLWRRRSSEPG